MVVTVVAMVLVACKKEKSTEVALQTAETEEITSNPIATFDNASGEIRTFVDPVLLTEKLNESYFIKGESNPYVVESVSVLDTMPRNTDVGAEIKITLLDAEEECSYSIWCMKSFVVKDVKEQQVDYYLEDNVANGNFDLAFKEGSTYYVANIVGDSLSIHEIDSLDFGCRPWIVFICRSKNCENKCEKTGSWYNAWCCRCPFPNADCVEKNILSIFF